MPRHRSDHAEPWPAGPMVPRPFPLEQEWSDAVLLHWRIPRGAAAARLPPGVEPDVVDGSAWVGLIGFRMSWTRLAAAVPLPWLGRFPEVNVRLYSRGRDGSRGVVFLSMDAPRLPVVLAARAMGVPYVWSRCRPFAAGHLAPAHGYEVERRGRQAASSFAVRPELTTQADDDVSLDLAARFGMHTRFAGRTVFLPVSHRPWPLHPAELLHLEDGLLAAAGLEVPGPPESVLFSPGVRAVFGRPRVVREQ
jgi:uncharacterized protein YqjF (DUF2071 family)